MTAEFQQAQSILDKILNTCDKETLRQKLSPKTYSITNLPKGHHAEALENRWAFLNQNLDIKKQLVDGNIDSLCNLYKNNIENFIGVARIPIGIAGPLLINGLFANGDFFIPLATTEAALVASYSRGSQLISESGGCTAILLTEGVVRTPGFSFNNLIEVCEFLLWLNKNMKEIKQTAESTTRFGKLKDVKITLEGNFVYLSFEYTTGDAAGQNMVTFATQTACEYIIKHFPIKPLAWYVDANMSGDKKASMQSFQSVRGKKVTAEVTIPADLVRKRLHTSPEKIIKFSQMSATGGVLSGTIGLQGHYANGLAALYIACGQDAACVAESAVGITRFDITSHGDLYVSVTLPNLIVGTIGGGTGLPTQQSCLDILGLHGQGKSQALAEVAASLCLAGEISISGAFASGTFSKAHQLLARMK